MIDLFNIEQQTAKYKAYKKELEILRIELGLDNYISSVNFDSWDANIEAFVEAVKHLGVVSVSMRNAVVQALSLLPLYEGGKDERRKVVFDKSKGKSAFKYQKIRNIMIRDGLEPFKISGVPHDKGKGEA